MTTSVLDEQGAPLWLEHERGRAVDVVALPLKNVRGAHAVYPLDHTLAHTDMIPEPAMPVSIIGYPFGLPGAGTFPIWKTGHIASEPELDYNGAPCFLIDATTREGMSGSPVVLRLSGGFRQKSGGNILAWDRLMTRWLGVYSGRIHGESEIGRVWRPEVVGDILIRGKRGEHV